MNNTTASPAVASPKRGPGRPRIYPPTDPTAPRRGRGRPRLLNPPAALDAPAKRPPGRPRLHPLPGPGTPVIEGKLGRKGKFVDKAARQRAWRDRMIASGYREAHTWVRVEPVASPPRTVCTRPGGGK